MVTSTAAPAPSAPVTEAPAPGASATSAPAPASVRNATVAPFPTVPPAPESTPAGIAPATPARPTGGPPAGELLQRAIAEARAETVHPFVTYHLHKRLVVTDAFAQDVAYDVAERASDRLTRFRDVTTGAVRLGLPEPRRPDSPPALWGRDARDVTAGVALAAAPTLLDAVHYDARIVGDESVDGKLAYRVLLEPHDGGLHDVLRSVLVEDATARIREVVTRRIVPLRISIAGKVRDLDVPADVTIDYAFVDGASVISHLRLIGLAAGHRADFQYDIDDVAFPETLAEGTFEATAASAPSTAPPATGPDAFALPQMNGQGVTMIALGDSLTVGIGTNACRGACVTGPARTGSGLEIPGALQDVGNAMLAAGARLTFVPLGVTGANSGSAPLREDPKAGDILTNKGQLPAFGAAVDAARARGDRIVVTLWTGGNDVFDAFYSAECAATGGRVVGASGGTLPCASAGTTLTGPLGDVQSSTFYRGYLRDVRAIAVAKPDLLIAMNVEDVSRLPNSLVFPESERQRLARDVALANESIASALRDSTFGDAVLVDLAGYAAARPELFGAPYVSVDGVHPSERGYRALAAAIVEAAGQRLNAAPSR